MSGEDCKKNAHLESLLWDREHVFVMMKEDRFTIGGGSFKSCCSWHSMKENCSLRYSSVNTLLARQCCLNKTVPKMCCTFGSGSEARRVCAYQSYPYHGSSSIMTQMATLTKRIRTSVGEFILAATGIKILWNCGSTQIVLLQTMK